MRKDIKKRYNGLVELRDYDVEECIQKNENMIINHDGEQLVLTPAELVSRRESVSPKFESKIAGAKNYHLYGYAWEPGEVEL